MIGALTGIVAARNNENLVIDVNGVGYEVSLTKAALDLCGAIGSDVRLIIYTDVRENAISLFGFINQMEKQVFLLVKKVKGIGSKSALAIVSALGAEGLLIAIGQQNIGTLQRVPGVGKKTAERIIVELREQVGFFVKAIRSESEFNGEGGDDIRKIHQPTTSSATILTLIQEDAILALEKLGVHIEKAKTAVSLALASGSKITDSGELVKFALSNL